MRRCVLTPLLALIALQVACSTVPGEQESVAQFVETQKLAARNLQSEEKLAQSLAVWRSLAPLQLDDEDVTEAISALEEIIEERVSGAMDSGESAYAQGLGPEGDTWMQKVLALHPGHEAALGYLKNSASSRARAEARSKSEGEYPIIIAGEQTPPEDIHPQLTALSEQGDFQGVLDAGAKYPGQYNGKTAELMRSAHVALANQAEEKGDLEMCLWHIQHALNVEPLDNDPLLTRTAELRASLSKNWYQEGTRLMKTDLPEAIAALEKSVYYNPYNSAAKLKLAQAETLQKNLRQIQSKNK